MYRFFDPREVDLSREYIEAEHGIPNIPLDTPPPGFYRMELLQWSYKGLLKQGTLPWDRPRCLKIREEKVNEFLGWAVDHYTWEHFLGEVNWISDQEALTLLEMLLERDVLHEMRRGILQKAIFEDTSRSQRLSEMDRMLAWIRVGNRWAWWLDALEEVPDPKYFPIPRLVFHANPSFSGGEIAKVASHLNDIDKLLANSGIGRSSISIMSEYVLYALGFLSELSDPVTPEIHAELARTFDLDLLLRWPASHFDRLLTENSVGKAAAFFPTPMSVATMMVEMVGAKHSRGRDGGDSVEAIEKRKQDLCSRISEPCAGTGNFLLPASNYYWLGGPFWDIQDLIKDVGRCQLALYAPWFAQTYFHAPPPYGSLAMPDELAIHASEQQKSYVVERQRSIYALDHWSLRLAETALSKVSSLEQLVQNQRETKMMTTHIRHRAENRATKNFRKTLTALLDLVSLSAEEVTHGSQSLVDELASNFPNEQNVLFDPSILDSEIIEGGD